VSGRLSDSSLGPAPNARVYGTRGYAIAQILGILFFSIVPFGMVYNYTTGVIKGFGVLLFMLVLMCGFIALLISQVPKMLARVATDERGVRQLRPFGSPVCLPWSAIASIEAHDARQFLLLRDSNGATEVRIEYQVKGFDQLRREIRERSTQLSTSAGSHPGEFGPSIRAVTIMVSIALAFPALVVLLLLRAPPALIPLAVPAIIAFAYFRARRVRSGISIRDHELELRNANGQTIVPFAEVERVEMITLPEKNPRAARVLLVRRNQEPLILPPFGNSEALYQAVLTAWQAGQKR